MDPFTEKRNQRKAHLFNCDRTYNLDSVESLLTDIEAKTSAKYSFLVTKRYFPLPKMIETCAELETYDMDFAVFVVHANESRLSINEDKAGIGYAKFYRTLLRATGDRVLIVIGGDEYYEGEEDTQVLSRWAKFKILSQFSPEYLDGRKSFIFSWETKHRLIHEDALLHFLGGTGQKFIPVVRPLQPEVESESPTRKPATAEKRQTYKDGTSSPFEEPKPSSFGSGRPRPNLVATKDTPILQPRLREEEGKPLIERSDKQERSSVLVLCHHVDEGHSVDVVLNCFRQVLQMLGLKMEVTSSPNAEQSLNAKRSGPNPDYVILLVKKDIFANGREITKLNPLLDKSDRLAESRSILVICKDREWTQNQHVTESVEQRFSHGNTLIISWNEDHPEFSYQAHAEYLRARLQEQKGNKETKVKMEDVPNAACNCKLCSCCCWCCRTCYRCVRGLWWILTSRCLWFWGLVVSCYRWVRLNIL